MSKSLHIRDLPDEVHVTLARRAKERGMSLRQYVIALLSEHTERLTTDEWLDMVKTALPPARGGVAPAGADVVRQSREEDDEELTRAVTGRGRRFRAG